MGDSVIIGFSKHRGFSLVSDAIRAVEQTPYSHVYFRWWSASLERWLVYHATRDNLNFQNMPNFNDDNTIIVEYGLDVTTDQRRSMIQYCIDNVHRKYGIMNLVGIAVVRFVRWTLKREIKNPFYDKEKTQICSELAGHVAYLGGVAVDLSRLEVEGPRYIEQCLLGCPTVAKL